jgi:predicted transcriptional regulator
LPKKKQYRTRLEIIAAILKTALDGANQTRMMYLALLSFTQVKDYLQVLTESGLLERKNKIMIYRTTAKGREFLDKYETLKI